jgi:hypothetical protein
VSDDRGRPEINPTARWLVYGAWKIALAVVVIVLVAGIIAAIVR